MSASVLAKLDGYMAAAGYGQDHPWRCEIGEALAAAPADNDGVLDDVDDIDCAASILTDLMKLAIQECVTAGTVGQAESALRAACRYIDDIRTATAHIAGRLGH